MRKGRAENGESDCDQKSLRTIRRKKQKGKKLNRSNEKAVPGPVKAHRLVLNRQRAAKCRAKAKQGASMVTTPDLSEQVVGKAVSSL